jgi:hypothetical protein
MNIKSLIPTSFGLGLCIFLISYAMQILLKFMGIEGAHAIAAGAASFSGAMLFTYYFYPHLMSRAFKIYAIITLFAVSILTLVLSLFVMGTFDIVRTGLTQIASDRTLLLAIIGSTIFSFAFQGLLLYFGTYFGNKEGLKMLAAQNKK